MTGWGSFQGVEQPFVASIPEPTSAALAALGGVAALLAALRRRIGKQ
jgi:hypothetical protein